MKRMNWVAILCTLVIFALTGCGPSREVVKLQADAQRKLGEAYMEQGQYTAALRELLKAEAIAPEDPYLQNDLGSVFLAKKEPELAVKHFKKALELKPDYAPAQNNLGAAYLYLEDWNAAIDTFKGLTADLLYATPHYPLANLGWAYYNKQNYVLSEKYYHEALDIDPDFPIALRGLGLVSLATNRVDRAVTVLEKAVRIYPEFAEAYIDLGNSYVLKGETEKAREAYQRVIALKPDTPLAQKADMELSKLE